MIKITQTGIALLFLFISLSVGLPAFSADFEKGTSAYVNGDYKTAFTELHPIAKSGDSLAQLILGKMYADGQGVPQNYKEAVKWYKLSAEQGEANAQLKLGLLYSNGEGVPQDYKEAAKWLTLSAKQGDAESQVMLGVLYSYGKGVSQDYIRGHMWLNLSASNGSDGGGRVRDLIAEKMTPAQLDEARDLAQECFEKDYKGC